MPSIVSFAHDLSSARRRSGVLLSLAVAALVVFPAAGANAQFGPAAAGTQVKDASALKPPVGAHVAIVEFADMECPACAYANPTLKAAEGVYKIPWVRHDFLIPGHIWSPQAAVNARWFDARSKALGGAYRDQVFANQNSIYSVQKLREFTQKFAADNHIQLPFAVDPLGKLAAAVKADSDLGIRTGITGTPSVWIVTDRGRGARYTEVARGVSNLYPLIDQALADDAAAAKAVPAKTPMKKAAVK
jgi:protein-disulfide isomerase